MFLICEFNNHLDGMKWLTSPLTMFHHVVWYQIVFSYNLACFIVSPKQDQKPVQSELTVADATFLQSVMSSPAEIAEQSKVKALSRNRRDGSKLNS